MFPFDYVLAVAVLIAPLDQVRSEELPRQPGLGRTIKEVALFWEILDRRESPSFFARPLDFAQDLELLRTRYRTLADAPPASDAYRFPPRDTACELLSFNREYTRTLRQRRQAVGSALGDLDRALEEAEQLYRLWDLVRDARSDCYYVSVRREALLNLRRALGREDYYRGIMPPHVPIWRFDRRD